MARISERVLQRAISEGRRGARRYELGLKLRYAVLRHGTTPLNGVGESVNISVSGLLFRGETRVYTGNCVVAALEWPMMGPDGDRLYLLVTGYVVRTRRPMMAISLSSKRLVRAREIDNRLELLFGDTPKTQAAAGPQIALVDADPATAAVISGILEGSEWTVKRAEAEAARWLLAGGLPQVDLVITQTPELLDSIGRNTPVVLIGDEDGAERLLGETQRPGVAILPRSELESKLLQTVLSICTRVNVAGSAGAML